MRRDTTTRREDQNETRLKENRQEEKTLEECK